MAVVSVYTIWEAVQYSKEMGDEFVSLEAIILALLNVKSTVATILKDAGLTAILGCGFDPGVSGIYTAYAAKHHFDEMHYLDIVDCNASQPIHYHPQLMYD